MTDIVPPSPDLAVRHAAVEGRQLSIAGRGNPTSPTPDGGSDLREAANDDGGMTSTTYHTTRPTVGPTPPRRRRTAGHVVTIVVGCLLLLPGCALLAGGGTVGLAQAVATDDDGYFRFTIDRVESDGVAVATTDVWFDDVDGDAPWVLDWLDLDLRVRVDGAAETDDVFVGVARSADVERYLAGASYSRIVELDERTPTYREVTGTDTVAPPVDEDIWAISVSGVGEQELTWNARGGRWSIVVMNPDGSPVVTADVEVGARSGAVTTVAITLLAVGGLVTMAAIVLIIVGARGRKAPGIGVPVASGASLPPPAPESAVRLDEDRSTSVS